MTAIKNLVMPPEPTITVDAAVAVLSEIAPSEKWHRRKLYLLAQRGQIPSCRIGWSVKFLESALRA